MANAHLATDANSAPKVDLELVPRVLVASSLDDTAQTVPSVVDDDDDATKMLVDLFEERLSAMGSVPDVVFDDEEFVGGINRGELGETGRFTGDCSDTFASSDHLPGGGLADASGSASDCRECRLVRECKRGERRQTH